MAGRARFPAQRRLVQRVVEHRMVGEHDARLGVGGGLGHRLLRGDVGVEPLGGVGEIERRPAGVGDGQFAAVIADRKQ